VINLERNPIVRELAKSMMRLSWSLSLFGVEQMSCLLRPRAEVDRAVSAFDSVAHSTEEQMGPATRATFHVGDGLQRGMVDLVFSLFIPDSWSWKGVVERGAAVRRAAEGVGRTVRGGSAEAQGAPQATPQATGWGPMPGAGRR
jgi:hypothetical protein